MSGYLDQLDEVPAGGRDDQVRLLSLVLVLARNKRLVLATTGGAFALSCLVAFLLPNVYAATVRLLPPQDNKAGLASMLGGMSDLAALAGFSVGGSSADLYAGMLRSRTVSDAVIDRFSLMAVYDTRYRVEAYEALRDHVEITVGKDDGILSVTVEDEVPQRAADMANAYVENLKKLNVEINLSSAGRERLFLENRLQLVKGDLTRAEERLREFQERHKAIRIDTQASAIIEAIARLRGELAGKEVELGVALSFQTEQSAQVKALREGIAQIREQIRKLEESPVGKQAAGDIFIATADVPALGVEYARLLRDFKIQETLFELLTKQYEVAKISEAKDTSTLQVLDYAAVPDKKIKPKRTLIVLAATFAAGFLALLSCLVREALEHLSPEDRALWRQIRGRPDPRPPGA